MYGGLKSLLRCVDTAFRTILDVVYPPMCASCHRRLTSSEKGVCVFCASKLVPYRSERWHAEERLWSVPAFRNLYSIYVYSKEQTIQEAIHAYKYHAYASFARMMARRAVLTLPLSGGGYDLIIVVPTTYQHILDRGYNQALIFAQYIAKALGEVEVSDQYILRDERAKSQTLLGRWGRQQNALGHFYCNPRKHIDLSKRHILVVDDVLTTGATLCAVLSLLEQYGAKHIDVLTATVAV